MNHSPLLAILPTLLHSQVSQSFVMSDFGPPNGEQKSNIWNIALKLLRNRSSETGFVEPVEMNNTYLSVNYSTINGLYDSAGGNTPPAQIRNHLASIKVPTYQYHETIDSNFENTGNTSPDESTGKIIFEVATTPTLTPGSDEALLNRSSVLFVAVSFILLMVISLAWLVFYYVQRFRYLHSKERVSRRLAELAKKAVARIPVKTLHPGDREICSELEQCAICIEEFRTLDNIRILPCRHYFHKLCIDPWLLEQRSCPMCKLDILQAYGLRTDLYCGYGNLDNLPNRNSLTTIALGGRVAFPTNDSDNHHATSNGSNNGSASGAGCAATTGIGVVVVVNDDNNNIDDDDDDDDNDNNNGNNNSDFSSDNISANGKNEIITFTSVCAINNNNDNNNTEQVALLSEHTKSTILFNAASTTAASSLSLLGATSTFMVTTTVTNTNNLFPSENNRNVITSVARNTNSPVSSDFYAKTIIYNNDYGDGGGAVVTSLISASPSSSIPFLTDQNEFYTSVCNSHALPVCVDSSIGTIQHFPNFPLTSVATAYASVSNLYMSACTAVLSTNEQSLHKLLPLSSSSKLLKDNNTSTTQSFTGPVCSISTPDSEILLSDSSNFAYPNHSSDSTFKPINVPIIDCSSDSVNNANSIHSCHASHLLASDMMMASIGENITSICKSDNSRFQKVRKFFHSPNYTTNNDNNKLKQSTANTICQSRTKRFHFHHHHHHHQQQQPLIQNCQSQQSANNHDNVSALTNPLESSNSSIVHSIRNWFTNRPPFGGPYVSRNDSSLFPTIPQHVYVSNQAHRRRHPYRNHLCHHSQGACASCSPASKSSASVNVPCPYSTSVTSSCFSGSPSVSTSLSVSVDLSKPSVCSDYEFSSNPHLFPHTGSHWSQTDNHCTQSKVNNCIMTAVVMVEEIPSDTGNGSSSSPTDSVHTIGVNHNDQYQITNINSNNIDNNDEGVNIQSTNVICNEQVRVTGVSDSV